MSGDQSTTTPAHRDIPDCVGIRVGDDGSVETCRDTRGRPTGQWRPLNTYRRPYGCRYVVVCIRPRPGDKVQCRYVHRLVLEAFVGPCPDGMAACHNDGDTSNNRLANLRWDTHQANALDKLFHDTMPMGSKVYCAKLTEADIPVIFALRAEGLSQQAIADRLGVSQTVISAILRGKTWSHVQ
jgi:hypothetical protein